MAKIVTFVTVVVLLLAGLAAASTPTGTVLVSYAPGACPQTNYTSLNNFPLDSSGAYSTGTAFAGFSPGSYCIKAHYNQDSSHNTSEQTTTFVVTSSVQDTNTTITCTPNPSPQGTGTTCSGTVSNAP